MNRPSRIMVIDDDIDMPMWEAVAQHFPETLLLLMTGGIIALRSLDQFDYRVDAIISDLSIPDINGISLTSLIRQNEDIRSLPPTPIFWFTGYPVGETIERSRLKYRVAEIFKKPMDPLELITRVKRYIAQQAVQTV